MGGSSLGVKGSEELTEGLKASFLIEMSPAVDDNSTGAAGMWNRQSYVSLDGGFGALSIGKQYSRAFNNVVGVDQVAPQVLQAMPLIAFCWLTQNASRVLMPHCVKTIRFNTTCLNWLLV